MAVSTIPEGYHSVMPYLAIKNCAEAIGFYKKAFGAIEKGRLTMPDGKIGHAEIEINGSRIMMSEENVEWGNTSPQTLGGTTIGICLYFENVDEIFAQAINAGATAYKNMVVKDEFYGDRTGTILDPFGHKWTIATHIEDVSFEEMQKRMDTMFTK